MLRYQQFIFHGVE